MENKLPSYLKMQLQAAPAAGNTLTCGTVRLTLITDSLIRLEEGVFTDSATQVVWTRDLGAVEYEVTRDGDAMSVRTEKLFIDMDGTKGLSGVKIRSLGDVGFTWVYGQQPLHNLGGTYSTLDQVNGSCPIDPGICSLDGYAVIDDTASLLMTDEGWFEPRQGGCDLYFFGYGHDYTRCVQDYYRLTGKPEMLPAFALGNWWSRYHAYSDEEYLDLMDRFEDKDVPLSVGIVDMDWHLTDGDGREYWTDGWTGYTWNEKLFPDYRRFLKDLHDRGLKTALNLHPALGVRDYEVQYEDMARAMQIDPATGEKVPFNCLDPQFLKSYFEILHFPYEKDGIDFWWMDWQQGTDYRKVIGQRYEKSPIEAITPLWMLNHMHYLASKREGKRGMIFSRYSGYGSQRYPIGFSGDSYITWESLAFQPYFTATASNIGYGWWSHDIGGHMGGYRDDELTVRWIQLGVFSPIFRLHSTSSVYLGREPWNYNRRAELIITDFMRLRHRLFPYLNTMNHRNYEELIPLIRPMYHLYPEKTEAYEIGTQYAFGTEMIVSPIVEKADNSDLGRAQVWLPEGGWIDAFTGYVYRGGQTLDVYRPLETMPIFLKKGAIVPLQAHEEKSRVLGGAVNMELLIAAGADGHFALYEDDGETLNYKDGHFATTDLTLSWQENEAQLHIASVKGDQDLVPDVRNWTVLLRGFAKGCTFSVNGEAVKAVYEADKNGYRVTLPGIRRDLGVTLSIQNDGALLHDNSDAKARAIDAITRAQNTQQEKNALGDMLDSLLNLVQESKPLRPSRRMGSDTQKALGGYLYELVSQL